MKLSRFKRENIPAVKGMNNFAEYEMKPHSTIPFHIWLIFYLSISWCKSHSKFTETIGELHIWKSHSIIIGDKLLSYEFISTIIQNNLPFLGKKTYKGYIQHFLTKNMVSKYTYLDWFFFQKCISTCIFFFLKTWMWDVPVFSWDLYQDI